MDCATTAKLLTKNVHIVYEEHREAPADIERVQIALKLVSHYHQHGPAEVLGAKS